MNYFPILLIISFHAFAQDYMAYDPPTRGRDSGGPVPLMVDCEKIPSLELCNNAIDKIGRHCSWDIEGMKCNEFGASDWHPLGWHPPMPPMFDGGGKGYGGDYGMGPVGDYGAGFESYSFDYGPSVVDASDFGYPGDGYLPPEIGDTGGVPEPFRGGYGPSREEFAPAPEPRYPGPPTSTDAIVDEGPSHVLWGECESVYDVALCNRAVDKSGRHCSWFYNEMKCNSFFESDYGGGWYPFSRGRDPGMPYGVPTGGGDWAVPFDAPPAVVGGDPQAPPRPFCPEYKLQSRNWGETWKIHEHDREHIFEKFMNEGPTFIAHMAAACSKFDRHDCTMQIACSWQGEKQKCQPFWTVAETRSDDIRTKPTVSHKHKKSFGLQSVHHSELSQSKQLSSPSPFIFNVIGMGLISFLCVGIGFAAGRSETWRSRNEDYHLQSP